MTGVGYHCSHEQHPPSALLSHAEHAVRAGFEAIMCSDHFAPWSLLPGQGHSGFAWSWLGAALARTEGASFGVVTAPGQRYHPAIVAQAAATLAEMSPGRFWLALGSGEALNEHITGDVWPDKDTRKQRLRECADVLRALFRGEVVDHRGLVTVHAARLHSRPARPPAIFGAAISEQTAVWMAPWVDGLITVPRTEAETRRFIDRFRSAGGENKPLLLQAPLSWAASDAAAEEQAFRGWRAAVVGDSDFKADTWLPEQFDRAASDLRPEDLHRHVRISASLNQHRDWCERDLELGFDRVYLHPVGEHPTAFIDAFADVWRRRGR